MILICYGGNSAVTADSLQSCCGLLSRDFSEEFSHWSTNLLVLYNCCCTYEVTVDRVLLPSYAHQPQLTC